MSWLIGLAGLVVADIWLYVVLLTLWQWVRVKMAEPDWVPAVWELRFNPDGPVPLGRPMDPETSTPLRDSWEPTTLPNPFAVVRDGKIWARYIKHHPKWTIGTALLWYVPEIVALVVMPLVFVAMAVFP